MNGKHPKFVRLTSGVLSNFSCFECNDRMVYTLQLLDEDRKKGIVGGLSLSFARRALARNSAPRGRS